MSLFDYLKSKDTLWDNCPAVCFHENHVDLLVIRHEVSRTSWILLSFLCVEVLGENICGVVVTERVKCMAGT
jgi:hypothetical protein